MCKGERKKVKKINKKVKIKSGPRMSEMVPKSQKWSQNVHYGLKWSSMVPNGPKWSKKSTINSIGWPL